MKTVIYLVRHGQSVANQLNKFCGVTDFPLSKLGKRQAEITADYLSRKPVDVVYSSDLSRAFYTAKAIADKKGLSVIKDKAFREMHCGVWEDMVFDELVKKYSVEFSVWQNDIGNFACPNGESAKDVQKRLTDAMKRIAEKHKGQTVCIASHAMAIRTFCGTLDGKSLSKLKNFPWPSNASVTTLEYENSRFKLITYSYDEHLADMITRLT